MEGERSLRRLKLCGRMRNNILNKIKQFTTLMIHADSTEEQLQHFLRFLGLNSTFRDIVMTQFLSKCRTCLINLCGKKDKHVKQSHEGLHEVSDSAKRAALILKVTPLRKY